MQKSVRPFCFLEVLAFLHAVPVAAVAYWFILCVGYSTKVLQLTLDQPPMYVPCIQVRHNSAIVYQMWTGARNPQRNSESLKNLNIGKYKGQVTGTSERNIRKAVDLLLQASPRKVIFNTVIQKHHSFVLGFLTLTVSDVILRPHVEVVKTCLKAFLEWLRRRKCLYIWKAELQERGQIHYHLTINEFIDLNEIRKEWNKLQRKAGYLQRFAQVHKHFNPNSIDIHSVRNVKDIESYLVKYICKKDTGQTIGKGKVWGCSAVLEGKRFSSELDYGTGQKLQKVQNIIELDNCIVFKSKGTGLLSKPIFQNYSLFIKNLKS